MTLVAIFNVGLQEFPSHHVLVILEDQIILSWPDAPVILFGLIYALHLNYPEK